VDRKEDGIEGDDRPEDDGYLFTVHFVPFPVVMRDLIKGWEDPLSSRTPVYARSGTASAQVSMAVLIASSV
jgi:hypothetical protein